MTGFEGRNALGDEYDPDDEEPGSHVVPVEHDCFWCGRAFLTHPDDAERWCSLECIMAYAAGPEVPPPTAEDQAKWIQSHDGDDIPF